MNASRSICVTLVSLILVAPSEGVAQQARDWDAGRVYVTRQDLLDMLQRLETVVNSDEYSGRIRAQSQQEAELVRNRLEFGDFSVGDRIWMLVEAESALTDTFTVRTGPILSLPLLGDVPLNGVLRSELVDHLTSYISRYIRNPVVTARSLIPLTVVGGVTTPGFYTVPTDGLFTDVLGLAGGPTATAKINEITIERDGEILYDKEFVAQAIVEGRTIDRLSLEAGDQIIVPASTAGGGFLGVLAVVGALIAIPAAIVTITRGR